METPKGRRAGQARERSSIVVAISGGGFQFEAERLLVEAPQGLDLVIAATPYVYEVYNRKLQTMGPRFLGPEFRMYQLPEQRSRRQPSWLRAAWRMAKAFVVSLRLLLRERPMTVIALGDAVSVPLLMAAKCCGARTVYIESLTRVTRPTTTGRVIVFLRLADRFYVQWPQAVGLYRGARYAGRLA